MKSEPQEVTKRRTVIDFSQLYLKMEKTKLAAGLQVFRSVFEISGNSALPGAKDCCHHLQKLLSQ